MVFLGNYSRHPTLVPGRTFFQNLSQFITFAAAPLVLTPFVRSQLARKVVAMIDADDYADDDDLHSDTV